jgi:hypothetical protein
VGVEGGPLSLVNTIEELQEKVAAPVQKTEITAVGDLQGWLRDNPVSAGVGTAVASLVLQIIHP